MIRPEELKKALCKTFCSGVSVNPVASGYAISSVFEDASGDSISCYLSPTDNGYIIEDDGYYLSHLIAKDIPIDQGTRGQLLQSILASSDAYWDRDTYEIKTPEFSEGEVSTRLISFLSSLIRVRDLELITREIVKSTFREDATTAMANAMGYAVEMAENDNVSAEFSDFITDLIVTPKKTFTGAKTGAIYFVNTADKLNEALLMKMETEKLNRLDIEVIALLEKPEMGLIGARKFQRAQNRDLAMPIFRLDESNAVNFIRKRLHLPEVRAS